MQAMMRAVTAGVHHIEFRTHQPAVSVTDAALQTIIPDDLLHGFQLLNLTLSVSSFWIHVRTESLKKSA
jgi:hypothetical protein